MGLEKTTININFASGVETLTDPNQLSIGRYTSLQNSVFVRAGGVGTLEKRNGFQALASLPDNTSSVLATFRDNLLACGNKLEAYSQFSNTWTNTGRIQPISLSVTPLVRGFYPPTMIDSALSPNGLVCEVFTAPTPSGILTNSFYYAVSDPVTGQSLLGPVAITPGFGSQTHGSKVFALADNFVVVFDGTLSSNTHLRYLTISSKTLLPTAAADVSTDYKTASTVSSLNFDGYSFNNTLYLSWGGRTSINTGTISSALAVSASVAIASNSCDLLSVTVDQSSGSFVYTTFVPSFNTQTAKIVATTPGLQPNFSAQTITGSGGSGIVNVVSAAQGGFVNPIFENAKTYTYVSAPTNNITTQSFSGASGSSTTSMFLIGRSLGLASKGFIVNSLTCVMGLYTSTYQTTGFLMGTPIAQGLQVPPTPIILGALAYGNAYSQWSTTVPNYVSNPPAVSVVGSACSLAYLVNTQVTPLNKATNVSSSTPTAGIFSNQGMNISRWQFGTSGFQSKEIAGNLNFNGGFLMGYDGVIPTENNFFLFPEPIGVVGSSSGGNLTAQTYYYQVIYQWTDAQGIIHRSSPSIPVGVTTTGGSSQIILNIPLLRLTYKSLNNPVTISIFRWSTAQQTYFKISPSIVQDASALNGFEAIPVSDQTVDSGIIGNEILYTNGGVLENAAAPALNSITNFDSRLWGIDAEDENLLWYSKQVIEQVPVEMSSFLTYFVPPDSSGINSTGGVKALGVMDDKLILFKKNSLFYINGTGPDITGANNQYSHPVFISAGVGCVNGSSIVLVPQGLMFQSDKGIWQLGRDLSVSFVGKEVEAFNSCQVLSALNVPGTNEARFTLGSSTQVLVYDYLAQQWDQFSVPATSSTVVNGLHTNLYASGSVSQELANTYVDGAVPVTMNFTTGWINLAGVQGYVRAYRMFILGKFSTPHTYSLGIAYDYNPQIQQTATINPTNSVGSGSFVEQWQVNFNNQQCQSFRLTFQETSSSTAGAGLTLSGIKVVVGTKADFPRNIGVRNKTG